MFYHTVNLLTIPLLYCLISVGSIVMILLSFPTLAMCVCYLLFSNIVFCLFHFVLLCFVFDMGSNCVALAGLKLLDTSNLPAQIPK